MSPQSGELKMAVMPIFGQKVKKSSPEPKVQQPLELVCSILDVGQYG